MPVLSQERYSLQRDSERVEYLLHSSLSPEQADEMHEGRSPSPSQKAVGDGSAVSQNEDTQSFYGDIR